MKAISRLYPCLLWLCLIWVISSIPSNDLPSYKIVGTDKLAHVGEYAILGLLANRWFKKAGYKGRKLIIAYMILVIMAGVDELHQSFIPGRTVSIYDLCANSSGLLIGYVFMRSTS